MVVVLPSERNCRADSGRGRDRDAGIDARLAAPRPGGSRRETPRRWRRRLPSRLRLRSKGRASSQNDGRCLAGRLQEAEHEPGIHRRVLVGSRTAGGGSIRRRKHERDRERRANWPAALHGCRSYHNGNAKAAPAIACRTLLSSRRCSDRTPATGVMRAREDDGHACHQACHVR